MAHNACITGYLIGDYGYGYVMLCLSIEHLHGSPSAHPFCIDLLGSSTNPTIIAAEQNHV